MLRDSLSKFYNYWLIGKENLFYLPVVISLIMVGLIFVSLWVDVHYTAQIKNLWFLYDGNLEDAKEILKILVSAMITMTTLVISITMVVLSLFASQLGPRLINSFLGDRVTQSFIGFFFGSIAICLTFLMYLHSNPNLNHQLSLSMSLVYSLSMVNLFVLLGYVNHIVKSGVADNIVTKVNKEFRNNIDSWVDQFEENKNTDHAINWPSDNIQETKSCRSGYIQSISYSSLTEYAEEKKIFVKLHMQAGDYILEDECIATVSGEKIDEDDFQKIIKKHIVIGDHRTSAQDIRYSIRHLSEIGLRALSPGINDNYTAINVVNELSGSLSVLIKKDFKNNHHFDSEDCLRVRGYSLTEEEIFNEAFSRIQQASLDKPDLQNIMLSRLTKLKEMTCGENCQKVINEKIKSLRQQLG